MRTAGHGARKNVDSLVEMWPCGGNLLREQLMEVGAQIRMLRNLYKYCRSKCYELCYLYRRMYRFENLK